MPVVSENQRRAMWAAKQGRSTLGIPKEVGEKFIAGDVAALAANAGIPAGARKLCSDCAMDMTNVDWQGLLDGLLKFFAEEKAEPEHMASDSRFKLAFDRESVREYDKDGRLRVKRTHISKANVCPYRGEEIPGWQQLGLQPDRIYNLLRDPEELKKAAPTLNGVPLLRKHVPVNADDHQPEEVVGSLGTDAEFDGEYLDNSLFVNAREDIQGIESGRKRELSAGYHYKPDMTPGNFHGSDYDGVMRDIVFNHVALVEDGRAGPDVVVGDEALKEKTMKATRFGALALKVTAQSVAPMLAYDSKPITLPKDIFAGLTQKNFNDNKAAIITGVRSALSSAKLRKGLALDAGMKSFAKAIDAFAELDGDEASEEVEGAEKIGPIDKPEPQKKDFGKGGKGFGSFPDGGETKDSDQFGESGLGVTTFDKAAVVDFLKGKGMADDAIEEFGVMMAPVWQKLEGAVGGKAPGNDSEEAMKKKAELEAQGADEEAEEAAKKKKDKDMIDKPAMDAALAAHGKRIRETERGIRVALAEVKPWVGDLPATLAFDSAADVYRHSLTMLGVEGAKTLHPDALAPVLKAQKRPGASSETRQTENSIAMDASSVSRAVKLAPGLANIQNVT